MMVRRGMIVGSATLLIFIAGSSFAESWGEVFADNFSLTLDVATCGDEVVFDNVATNFGISSGVRIILANKTISLLWYDLDPFPVHQASISKSGESDEVELRAEFFREITRTVLIFLESGSGQDYAFGFASGLPIGSNQASISSCVGILSLSSVVLVFSDSFESGDLSNWSNEE